MPHGPFTRIPPQARVRPSMWNELQEALENAPTMAEGKEISGQLAVYGTTPPGADGTTDGGYMFNATYPTGMVTEVEEILTFGINVSQLGTRDATKFGGYARLDARDTERSYSLVGIPGGTSTEVKRFAVNLATSETYLAPDAGSVGIRRAYGTAPPTALLHIGAAGTTAAGSAPIKLTTASAALNTTAEAGALETDGTDLYWTNNAGVRKKVTIA